MHFISKLLGCNCCNRNCRSSLCQNVRMKYVDAGGAESCIRKKKSCHCHCTCNEHIGCDCE